MQPRYAAYEATVADGDIPLMGMAQLFVELAPEVQERLRQKGWKFYPWGPAGCRLMCAWDTTPDTVDRFAADIIAALAA